MFWKDYLTKPHQKVAKEKLAHITGTLSQAGNTISLPSGYSSSHYIIIKEANTTFIPAYINWSEFVDEVADSATITMAIVRKKIRKLLVKVPFAKHNNKEYITETEAIEWYNKTIDKKRNTLSTLPSSSLGEIRNDF